MLRDGKFSKILLGEDRVSRVARIHNFKNKVNDFEGNDHKLQDYKVFVDSGAHTLYNFHVRDNQDYNSMLAKGVDPFTFYDSDTFKNYLDDYIEFLHLHKDSLEFYVTLDVIKNPKRTWDVLKYMESCGLNPMPVYHYGEDIKWFKKMIEEYEYVGIGGLGQEVSKNLFFPFADKLFDLITDARGTPRIKTHGFAITSIEVLKKYPWHTTDSSTWTTLSRSGTVIIPRRSNSHEYDVFDTPIPLPVSEQRKTSKKHYLNQTPTAKAYIDAYFESIGVDYHKVNSLFHFRDVANIKYYLQVTDRLKSYYTEHFDYEQGGNILYAGTPSGSSSNLSKFVRLLTDLDTESIGWLGSVYYPLVLNNLIEVKKIMNSGKSPMQGKLHKPKKISGLTTTAVPKKSTYVKSIKVKVKVEYEYEYKINAAPYKGKTPEQVQEKELGIVKSEFSKVGHSPTTLNVDIERTE